MVGVLNKATTIIILQAILMRTMTTTEITEGINDTTKKDVIEMMKMMKTSKSFSSLTALML